MDVQIRPVRSRRDQRRFIDLPFRLYDGVEHWVPPLRLLIKQQLDRKHNPFFQHAEVELFLAWRDGRVVGRISAQVDRNLHAFQDNRWGQFGFFECEDRQETADALLDAASAYVRGRGCDRLVGPSSFTTNDECGLLVAGHGRPPTVMTGWHHPYYRVLLERAGMTKAMDTLMWDAHVRDRENVHPAIWRIADRVESDHGIRTRYFNKKDLPAEIERFLDVYNAAWEKNWGFVPLTETEVRAYAKELGPVLDENWAMVSERIDTGETVGAALTLPDLNQVLARLPSGRLLPFGWLTLLRHRKDADRIRVMVLGSKPEYQMAGVGAKLYEMHYRSAQRTPQGGGEMGWILESNVAMNKAMVRMGGTLARRYRFYERLLEDGAEPSVPPDTRYSGDWVDPNASYSRGAAA